MDLYRLAALAATGVLGLLGVFQALLALGFPLGRAAWGGAHRILPPKLRWGSSAAIPILGVAAWVVLSRAGLVGPGSESSLIRFSCWVFAGFFALNTAGNISSKSPPERTIMTPVSTLLSACFFVVALS